MSVSDFTVAAHRSPVGVLELAEIGSLLLPGPYAVCAPKHVVGPLK